VVIAATLFALGSTFRAYDRQAILHMRGAWGEEITRDELKRAKRRTARVPGDPVPQRRLAGLITRSGQTSWLEMASKARRVLNSFHACCGSGQLDSLAATTPVSGLM